MSKEQQVSDKIIKVQEKQIELLKSELERVKEQRDYYTNQYHRKSKRLHEKNSIIDVLRVEKAELQAENERLREFVKDFLKVQKENYGHATNTHLAAISLANQAQELLKEKE